MSYSFLNSLQFNILSHDDDIKIDISFFTLCFRLFVYFFYFCLVGKTWTDQHGPGTLPASQRHTCRNHYAIQGTEMLAREIKQASRTQLNRALIKIWLQ